MDKKTTFPTIGFIGTGAITSAIITGLCERVPEKTYPIVVSPEMHATQISLKNPTRDG